MKPSFLTLIFAILTPFLLQAQEQKNNETVSRETQLKFAAYDGTIVAGYVDHGAYLNFTGPNISLSRNNSKIMLGMLPSLRIKEDNKEPKNSLVTPGLGIGLTYYYKHIAFQLPLYYNAKTSTEDGKWNCGIGLGIRLKS
jgi:hypothetical protein